MAKSIASLAQSLGTAAKLFRLLRKDGLPDEAIHLPIDDSEMRRRLVRFWANGGHEWLVWRRLKFGTVELPTMAEYSSALEAANCQSSSCADSLFWRLVQTVVEPQTELDLVDATVEEIGFPQGAHRGEIYARAKRQGLDLCPQKTGPQLRLEYLDQPAGELLHVAMEPIAIGQDGEHGVWCIEHGKDGLWLDSADGSVLVFWPADTRWIWCRRR